MENETTAVASNTGQYTVTGVVRDQNQALMAGAQISVYTKTLRNRKQIATGVTGANGGYSITYSFSNTSTAGIIVSVNDSKGNVLKESDIQYKVPAVLKMNFDLGSKPYTGPDEYDALIGSVIQFTGEVPLGQMTETAADPDITFMVEKTGLPQTQIEKLVMAARFALMSTLQANLWYGILSQMPSVIAKGADFEASLSSTFDALMQKSTDILMNALQQAISSDIIAYSVTPTLDDVRKRLATQLQNYATQHPVTGAPSLAMQQAQISGLTGDAAFAFVQAVNSNTDSTGLWTKLRDTPALNDDKTINSLQTVMQVSALTGNQMAVTQHLVSSQNLASVSDIKKLAGTTKDEWVAMLKAGNIKLDGTVSGKNNNDKIQQIATSLDASFAAAYPTATFTARLQKDTQSNLPHADKVGKFLQANENFDLLNNQVGTFIKNNKQAVPQADADDVTTQVRRMQRVFRLTRSYEGTTALLKDNIHSAQQIFKMGKNNFVNKYSPVLGQAQAAGTFEKAATVQANAVALTANLRSMTDASAMNAFPNFSADIATGLSSDLPNLTTLFGQDPYCDCDECSSVYGAPAYLTDILHFLSNRLANVQNGPVSASVKDNLLMRRPDIADIDLNCDNSNTQIPYIDIACELMEDFIAPPVIPLDVTSGSLFTEGVINSTLLTTIKTGFTTAGFTNVPTYLTSAAIISDSFTSSELQTDGTFLAGQNWIIRDKQVTLKATINTNSTGSVRILHQTLQSSDTINAEPEYINAHAYTTIASAVNSFNLPLDMYETEGELYLQQLGISKADLNDIFRKEDHTPPGTSVSDNRVGYTSLNINSAEQTLIFQADISNQTKYWGAMASAATAEIDLLEQKTGLAYADVEKLISLQFINPAKDTVIEHDGVISPDGVLVNDSTSTQNLTNLTPTKFDVMHRFIRLWRKTTFNMDELDAIVMAPSICAGTLTLGNKAYLIHQFITLQQRLQLSAFQLLSFYQNIDTTRNLPNCLYNQVFQNSAITNPVNALYNIATATAGTTALTAADQPILAAILQIPVTDVAALLTKTNSKITLANFTLLYKHTVLARALDVSITDLLNLLNLIDANPFTSVVTTIQFLDKYKLLQSSGFSIDELNYILRHQNNVTHTQVPSTGQITSALTQLQNDLLAIQSANQPAIDSNGVLMTKWLSDGVLNWDRSMVTRLVDILNTADDATYLQKISDNTNFLNNLRVAYHDAIITTNLAALPLDGSGNPIAIPASISAQLTYNSDKKQLQFVGYMSATDQTAALAALATTPTTDPNLTGWTNAINYIFTTAQQTSNNVQNVIFTITNSISTVLSTKLGGDTADRFAYFINKISGIYIGLLQQNALIKDISNWFMIDNKVSAQLLTSIPAIFTDFSNFDFVNKNVPLTNATQVNRYLFVAKIGFIASRLKLTATDLAFTLAHAADINILNLATLPLAPVTAALPTTVYPTFEALINTLKFQQQYPAIVTNVATGNTLSLYTVLTLAATPLANDSTGKPIIPAGLVTSILTNLAQLTGWNLADLTTLATPTSGTLTLNFPADFRLIPVYLRLAKRITTQQQLGIGVTDGFTWTKDQLLAADVAKIKQTLKSKMALADWVQVSTTLQNTLRETRRDALIAYLLSNPGSNKWTVADDLYSFFLLDVQMCSCQPTSRIVQATNSVQLFVQRCFLQLESGIIVNSDPLTGDTDWTQWTSWMSQFRVWQANMKIFLYPESYIEPDLLPAEIKSSQFADLENYLLQNSVTQDVATAAFSNYLSDLQDVSRLEVKAQYYDDLSDILHVFARTYGGDPKVYYYRTYVENRRWTPWEKINVDITSDFIIPVVFNRHLYLFWGLITQETQTGYMAPANSTTAPPQQWVIQLAYSEYQDGQWSPKKVQQDDASTLIVKQSDGFLNMSSFYFSAYDIPTLDYNAIYKSVNQVDADALIDNNRIYLENGTLLINCFYTSLQSVGILTKDFFVGNFILDITKGYPVPVNIKQSSVLQNGSVAFAPTNAKYEGVRVNLINMLQAELNPPANVSVINIDGTSLGVPGQVRTAFTKTVTFHPSVSEKAAYVSSFLLANRNTALPTFGVGVLVTSSMLPHFYQDNMRTYFIRPEFSDNASVEYTYEDYKADLIKSEIDGDTSVQASTTTLLATTKKMDRYFNFYHPYVGYFMQQLFIGGIDGFISRSTQLKGDPNYDTGAKFNFATAYSDLIPGLTESGLGPVLDQPIYTGPNNSGVPQEDVDFDITSGYGFYNWELFYHAPLLIAERLSQNQQFDDATKWYHYIFNPTDTSPYPSPNKFWNTKPFFETTQNDYASENINQLLQDINSVIITGPNAPITNPLIQDVADWRNNPFQPHYIAETRTVAYQKVAVMKYIGHLVRYADYLFTQDTMETVNQATQLYILASEILGPKPEITPSITQTEVASYRQLAGGLDALSDSVVSVENLLPLNTIKGYTGTTPTGVLPNLQTLYFCIPPNENLIGPTGYWDIIADRLYKIRHCLNINGTLAPLALFSPVIDPALLVRATAAGIDIGSVLNDLNAPLPLYRFSTIMAKATELTNEVKNLGNLLLSVLEKNDAETLSLLRSTQEIKVTNAVMLIKQQQVLDAQNNLNNLTAQKDLVTVRQSYYSGLISAGLNGYEDGALTLNGKSINLDVLTVASYFSSSIASAEPDETAGTAAEGLATGPYAHVTDGGNNAGNAFANLGRNLSAAATAYDKKAAVATTYGSYLRRSQEWQFQLDSANKELAQLDLQIIAAQFRIEIASQDVVNQQLLIDNASDMDAAMRGKFTNQELFSWMITQVSTTYFQSYQLAYNIAKQAERCYQYELAVEDSAFINFGYWDSLHKGLLAGEQMLYDLKNLEMAYMQQNQREMELTKMISLSSFDPIALTKLKTGANNDCWINLPEELFDIDYPGHYMRRVKSVSLTIPCIAGPYTTVSAKLTMTNNSMRVSPLAGTTYSRNANTGGTPADDTRFRDSIGTIQSMATSHAQNDSGLFELNFRDERYLPFEGAGAISLWHLELPAAMPQFDYDTISDVIITLKYTARDGGSTLKASAKTSLMTSINNMILSNNTTEVGLMRVFSAKNDLATEWYRFLNPVNNTDDQTLALVLDINKFPFFVRGKTIKIKAIELIAEVEGTLKQITKLQVTPAPITPTTPTLDLIGTGIYGSSINLTMTYNADPGTFTIVNPAANNQPLTSDNLSNMVVIVHYTATQPTN